MAKFADVQKTMQGFQMIEKKTQGEQAEEQMNKFIESGLNKIEKPPTGLGPAECSRCGDEIPIARRQAYGNGLCIDCAEMAERR